MAAFLFFISCQQSMRHMHAGIDSPHTRACAIIQNSAAHPDTTHTISGDVFGVVLLHGLNMTVDEIGPIEQHLRDHYKDQVKLMKPTFREGIWSCVSSLSKQEATLYDYVRDEIKNTLADAYCKRKTDACCKNKHKKCKEKITDEQIRSFPFYIIGNSQGGALATIFVAKRHQSLNILGLVSHNGALLGANILARTRGDILEFQTIAQEGLKAITHHTNPQISVQKRADMNMNKNLGCVLDLINRDARLCNVIPLFGLKDTLPNNAHTKLTHHFLRKQAHNVACLLIGGFQNDLGSLLPFSINTYANLHNDQAVDQSILALNRAHAKLVTGSENDLHDQVLPLKTQLCRGDSLDDLTEELKNLDMEPKRLHMPDRDHIECLIFKGITHCENLPTIGASYWIEKQGNESMCQPRRMLPELVKFIDAQQLKLQGK